MQAYHELPDYLAPGLSVLFVGFNPGEISARIGHYYANPRNQFWYCVSKSGLVPRPLTREDDHLMPHFGLGLTDLVKRPTKSANELRASDFRQGRRRLKQLLEQMAPRVVAFNGKGVYKNFVGRGQASHGLQPERFGDSVVFVLPSTSPANARLAPRDKLRYFQRLARWVNGEARGL